MRHLFQTDRDSLRRIGPLIQKKAVAVTIIMVVAGSSSPPRKQPPNKRRTFSYHRRPTKAPSEQRSISAYLHERSDRNAASKKRKVVPKKRSHLTYTREEQVEPPWNVLRQKHPSHVPTSAAMISIAEPPRQYHRLPWHASTPAPPPPQLDLSSSCDDDLSEWNAELAALTRYIQLTAEELQLRHAFIQQLEQRFLRSAQQCCRVFGSFATTPICTFQSDLDLAVWDAPIATSSTPANVAPTTNGTNGATHHEPSAASAPPPAGTTDPAPRVEKWRLALAAVDDAPIPSTEEISKEEEADSRRTMDMMSWKYDPDILYCGEGPPDEDYDSEEEEDSADPMTSYEERPILPVAERHHNSSMHVSWYASSSSAKVHSTVLPTYRKVQVVDTLSTLCSRLRKKSHRRTMAIQHITLIKTAKVPIIKIQTTHGFSVDICVGGFGTDTSLYAQEQMHRYPHSFVPVVLVLKTLLVQHRLDEPYTGGLGSYKLYILVAHHIHLHLQRQKDPQDREHYPWMVLYTFLYRYGYGTEEVSRSSSWKRRKRSEETWAGDQSYPTTPLSQFVPFHAQDGPNSTTCADLSNVYKLNECLSLFRKCYQRLNEQIQSSQRKTSLLAHVICPWTLQKDREQVLKQIPSAKEPQEQPPAARRPPSAPSPLQQRDRTLEEIVAGYGMRVEDLTSP